MKDGSQQWKLCNIGKKLKGMGDGWVWMRCDGNWTTVTKKVNTKSFNTRHMDRQIRLGDLYRTQRMADGWNTDGTWWDVVGMGVWYQEAPRPVTWDIDGIL